MGLYKFNMFDSYDRNISQSGYHLNAHNPQMILDMAAVLKQGNAVNGIWCLARLTAVGDSDPKTAIGNYYYVYVPLDSNGAFLNGSYNSGGVNISYKVAAPCPPFCDNPAG